MTINDLPIEQQREIAKKIGWEDFDDFQKAMQNIGSIFKHFDEEAKKHDNLLLARERIIKKIEFHKQQPETSTFFFRRMTDNYDMTENDVLEMLMEGLARIDTRIAKQAAIH